jgi:hypothetical protein
MLICIAKTKRKVSYRVKGNGMERHGKKENERKIKTEPARK